MEIIVALVLSIIFCLALSRVWKRCDKSTQASITKAVKILWAIFYFLALISAMFVAVIGMLCSKSNKR